MSWNAGLAGNRTTPSFAYAICANGLTSGGIVTTHVATPPLGAVTCPAGQLLVGGGYLGRFQDTIASSTNALALPSGAWMAGSPNQFTLDIYGICVMAASAA
jgi:hypothetical protein